MTSRSMNLGQDERDGFGLTQEQLEDVLARVTALQCKVTALSDRLGLYSELVACGTATAQPQPGAARHSVNAAPLWPAA